MRRNLPVFDERCLDNVGIANPCDVGWERMRGDDRVRHCPACRLNVYNVSAMTRPEAAALITTSEGRFCIKMFKRSDGTLITQDCRERLRRARKRGLVAFAVALTIVCITQLGIRVLGLRALLEWSRTDDRVPTQTQVDTIPVDVTTPETDNPTQRLSLTSELAAQKPWTPDADPIPPRRPAPFHYERGEHQWAGEAVENVEFPFRAAAR